MPVGLMLYSVRDECARDFEGTLRSVAGIGYDGVELFDLHGHDATAVRGWLDAGGLAACARHAPLEALETRLPELAAEGETMGTRRLVLSWLDPAALAADADGVLARVERVADAAAAHGVELGFHNHDAELRPRGGDGSTFLDSLLGLPLFLELDLGWAWWADVDPVALLERVPRGRVPLVHVKDFPVRGERTFCPVGDGGVGYERVAPAALAAGAEWLLVEQDEADGSSLEAARRSHDALRAMLARA